MTYLTGVISASDIKQVRSQVRTAVKRGAQMLEMRTDYLENLNTEVFRKAFTFSKTSNLPIIVTCRDKRQGGANEYSAELRSEILVTAIKTAADYVDCEFDNYVVSQFREKLDLALAETSRTRLIVSAHNFDGPFNNIDRLYRDILTVAPASIPKLVYTAKHINDCFDGLRLLSRKHGQAIVLVMGPEGIFSRIIAKRLGCFANYAGISHDEGTAPGQLTIDELRNSYRYDAIDEKTLLYGVIGSPIAHSLSPAIFNACFGDSGMNRLYLPMHVQDSKEQFYTFMQNANQSWLGFRGFSVTIPHKKNALDFVRERGGRVEPPAARIGAVNTILIDSEGNFSAYNTDYAGALGAITSTLGISAQQLQGTKAAVIGAGGVSRAIVAGLRDVGADVVIYNRTVSKADALAAEFGCRAAPLSSLASFKADLLINATSIGMFPDMDKTPLVQKYLSKDTVVFDTVYNPIETRLLKAARAVGAKTIDGAAMFVAQAAAQFKLFTGEQANTRLMRKIVAGRLGTLNVSSG
ncbi:MAG: shikimate dehydrogenase [Planctomycetota bacterium]